MQSWIFGPSPTFVLLWQSHLSWVNPNQGWLFGWSKEWVGWLGLDWGWNLSERLVELLWTYFSPNQSKNGPKWNLASSYNYRNIEQHPMDRSFFIRWQQSNLVWRQYFQAFGSSIFERLKFFTYMDNMHIWIFICHQKVHCK